MDETTNRDNESSNPEDKAIPGPKSNRSDYPWHIAMDRKKSPIGNLGSSIVDLVRSPVHWFRENVVEKNRGPKYYWYHRKFAPALPIDECYIDDPACAYEASKEMERLMMVDKATLNILKYRREHCRFWEMTKTRSTLEAVEACKHLEDTYNREEINFFIKYGDQPWFVNSVNAYTKQKHRLIMERRIALREKQQSIDEQDNNNNNNSKNNNNVVNLQREQVAAA